MLDWFMGGCEAFGCDKKVMQILDVLCSATMCDVTELLEVYCAQPEPSVHGNCVDLAVILLFRPH